MKDKISWFGEKGKDGLEVTKMAGKAMVTITAVAITGAVLGATSKLIK